MTEILDAPVPTKFNHGWFFPLTTRLMGYTALITGGIFALGNLYVGIAVTLVGIFISFSFSGVQIDTEKEEVIEYTNYFGFIKTTKKYSYLKLYYITAMPKRVSKVGHANLVQNTVETNYKFIITLFTENFRTKKEITIYDSKSESEHIAKQLGGLLNLTYFDYDPQFVRDRLNQR